jgi:hypothetical protein
LKPHPCILLKPHSCILLKLHPCILLKRHPCILFESTAAAWYALRPLERLAGATDTLQHCQSVHVALT